MTDDIIGGIRREIRIYTDPLEKRVGQLEYKNPIHQDWLTSDVTQLKEKVKDLEEWKRDKENVAFPVDYPGIKIIDKKVWEAIRILLINLPWEHYRKFDDLIKKTECPND